MVPDKTSALPVRLIGIGSALGADQIGWLAVHRLDMVGFTARYPENFLDIDICPSPALLVSQYSSARALILLDAYCSTDPKATVKKFTLGDLNTVNRPCSSHGLDLLQALAICDALDNTQTQVLIVGICIGQDTETANCDKGQDILDMAFPSLIKVLDDEINHLLLQTPKFKHDQSELYG